MEAPDQTVEETKEKRTALSDIYEKPPAKPKRKIKITEKDRQRRIDQLAKAREIKKQKRAEASAAQAKPEPAPAAPAAPTYLSYSIF